MKKLACFFTLIYGCSFAQIPIDQLVAHYTFDGNWLDESVEQQHIVSAQSTFATDRFGSANKAVSLNGISDSLVLPVAEFSPIVGDFALSLWYKTASPEKMNLFSLQTNSTDTVNNFNIQLSAHSELQANLELYFQTYIFWNGSGWSGNNAAEGSTGAHINGKWSHLVIQRVNDSLQIYRNDLGLGWSSYSPNSDDLGSLVQAVIGAWPYRFEGEIDDLRCYTRALTISEIHSLYHENRPFVFISPQPTDAYVKGSNILASWAYDATMIGDSILVETSLNGGPWEVVSTHSQLYYENYTYLDFDLPYGSTLELKVTDQSNPLQFVQSGPILVSDYEWVEVCGELPFTPRDGSCLVNFNNRLWLFGGWDPPNHPPLATHSEIWSSADGVNWTYHNEAPWPPRHCGIGVVKGATLFFYGADPQSSSIRDVWSTVDGINWFQLEDTIPNFSPRNMQMGAVLGNQLLNFGGQLGTQYVADNLNEVWSSEDGIIWNQLPNAPWRPRGMVLNNCVDANGYLWLLGGGRLNDRRHFNDVWRTNDGVNWEEVLHAAPWLPRYWHTVASFDDQLWVMAGMTVQTDGKDVWYSPDGENWRELKGSPFGIRHAHSTTVYDNALWLLAGINSNNAWKLVNRRTLSSNSQSNEKIHLYPNPTRQVLHLDDITNPQMYTIVDATGKVIRFGETSGTIDIQGLQNGSYLLHINQQTTPFVVE